MNVDPVAAPVSTVVLRRGKLITNVISMLGSDMLGKALLLVFFLLVAELVSREEMGKVGFCTSTTAFLAIAINFGLRLIVVRETAQDASQCRRFVETILWQRLVFMAFGIALLYALVQAVPKFRVLSLEMMIAGVSVCMLQLTDLGTAVCEGLERMHWVPIINAVDGGSRILSLILVFFLPHQAWVVLSLMCAAQTMMALVSLACASHLMGAIPLPRRHPNTLGYAMRQGAPLAMVGLAQKSYARFDWIFLGLYFNPAVLAPYSVGYRIYEGLNLIGPSVLRGTFPRLTQSVETSPDLFTRRLVFLIKAMLLANTFVAAVAILHVGNVLSFYGDKYMEGEAPAMLLLCGLPFWGVYGALYHAFLAHKRQKIMLLNGALIAVINILINVFAIPYWGTMAAAAATAIPYVIGMAVAWCIYGARIGTLPWQWSYLRCVLPAIPTVLFGLWFDDQWSLGWVQGWLVEAMLQMLIFVSLVWLLRPFDSGEKEMLSKVIRRKV